MLGGRVTGAPSIRSQFACLSVLEQAEERVVQVVLGASQNKVSRGGDGAVAPLGQRFGEQLILNTPRRLGEGEGSDHAKGEGRGAASRVPGVPAAS